MLRDIIYKININRGDVFKIFKIRLILFSSTNTENQPERLNFAIPGIRLKGKKGDSRKADVKF